MNERCKCSTWAWGPEDVRAAGDAGVFGVGAHHPRCPVGVAEKLEAQGYKVKSHYGDGAAGVARAMRKGRR